MSFVWVGRHKMLTTSLTKSRHVSNLQETTRLPLALSMWPCICFAKKLSNSSTKTFFAKFIIVSCVLVCHPFLKVLSSKLDTVVEEECTCKTLRKSVRDNNWRRSSETILSSPLRLTWSSWPRSMSSVDAKMKFNIKSWSMMWLRPSERQVGTGGAVLVTPSQSAMLSKSKCTTLASLSLATFKKKRIHVLVANNTKRPSLLAFWRSSYKCALKSALSSS